MKIAVVGATGLVGSVMLKVLNERGFANQEIIVAASSKSVGKQIPFADRLLTVVSVEQAINSNCDYAIFSAGSGVSKQYAPMFKQHNTTVIDNSSCWRMDKDCPLVVPEINIDAVKDSDRIIANPNCSTIQMVLALYPLDKAFDIKRIVVSTYQSITGTGIKAVKQLEAEEKGLPCEKAYVYQIHHNVFPHGGDFLENGYTTEEEKLVNETRKILSKPEIRVSATVARVPVKGGHSESVNIEFNKPFDIKEVYSLLEHTPGITVMDDIKNNIYPMPIISEGKDDVFVGRIRRDDTLDNGLNMWVVSDNLRKGAATNAIQIMEKLIEKRK
ncbi:MAG: aspartate-semialdehyde dehydrogenase [Bacteroidales bacterium]|jgi:aspartate-semialdehyde dehydrogenase|nr:aspartate-semialdehyde dehydrogenase [Bacteroidales bacterium]